MKHEIKDTVIKNIVCAKGRQFSIECEVANFSTTEPIVIYLTQYYLIKLLTEIFDYTNGYEIAEMIKMVQVADDEDDFKYVSLEQDGKIIIPHYVKVTVGRDDSSNRFGVKSRHLNKNEFFLTSLSKGGKLNRKKDMRDNLLSKKVERIEKIFGLLALSLKLYNEYIEIGFPVEYARKNSGLDNDLLFEIAKLKSDN